MKVTKAELQAEIMRLFGPDTLMYTEGLNHAVWVASVRFTVRSSGSREKAELQGYGRSRMAARRVLLSTLKTLAIRAPRVEVVGATSPTLVTRQELQALLKRA